MPPSTSSRYADLPTQNLCTLALTGSLSLAAARWRPGCVRHEPEQCNVFQPGCICGISFYRATPGAVPESGYGRLLSNGRVSAAFGGQQHAQTPRVCCCQTTVKVQLCEQVQCKSASAFCHASTVPTKHRATHKKIVLQSPAVYKLLLTASSPLHRPNAANCTSCGAF